MHCYFTDKTKCNYYNFSIPVVVHDKIHLLLLILKIQSQQFKNRTSLKIDLFSQCVCIEKKIIEKISHTLLCVSRLKNSMFYFYFLTFQCGCSALCYSTNVFYKVPILKHICIYHWYLAVIVTSEVPCRMSFNSDRKN